MPTIEPLPYYRQSLIARFDQCPLSVLFALQDKRRTPGEFAARGSLFHRFAHQATRQIWESGERGLPIEVGMEMLAEILCQADVPSDEVLPLSMNMMRWLRVLVTKWCENFRLDPRRIIATEKRFYADVVLPIGETVQISGQLDLLLADPPKGVTVVDWKSGTARAAQPRNAEKEKREGTGLTALGWAQWLIYSHLLFANFPSIEYVTFREVHVLRWEIREARMERWEHERLQDVLAGQVALLHQAVGEGAESERWVASGGSHCSTCASPRHCPIVDAEGIPTTQEEAQRMAQEWVISGEIRKSRADYLKGWVDENGPIEVPHARGRRMVGWELNADGSRNFKLFEPEEMSESPYDQVLFKAGMKSARFAA